MNNYFLNLNLFSKFPIINIHNSVIKKKKKPHSVLTEQSSNDKGIKLMNHVQVQFQITFVF